MNRLRLRTSIIVLTAGALLGLQGIASASLNPPRWQDWNCALQQSSDSGASWDSRGTMLGFLYYGADNDNHGTTGVCEWLADGGVKAVQSRWVVGVTFSVPLSRYKPENLKAATGSMQFTGMSDAASSEVTSQTDAGYIAVDFTKGAAGVEIGGSSTRNFKRKMLTGQNVNIPVKLNSKDLGRCVERERSSSRVQVFCSWTINVGTFSWIEPQGRTEGGLQIMSLKGNVGFPGARSVTLQGIFQDNP